MRGGLIRPPADNVRLVCDPQLQPGIPSIETPATSAGIASARIDCADFSTAPYFDLTPPSSSSSS
jgi:hypothetical protein